MENSLSIIKMARQAILIMIFSSLVGVGVNYIRRDGISLLSGARHHDLAIDVDTAKKLFFARRALFVDARAKEFYERLHIKGAINIPIDAAQKLVKKDLSKDKVIITYCDDKSCDLGEELAMELYSLGFDNVYYLRDGIEAWISRNLPVEKVR